MAKQPKIGGKIVLDGEKEYKNAITNINSSMKVLQSEMKKVTSEFGNNQGSTDATHHVSNENAYDVNDVNLHFSSVRPIS